jgi:hypothetical protein
MNLQKRRSLNLIVYTIKIAFKTLRIVLLKKMILQMSKNWMKIISNRMRTMKMTNKNRKTTQSQNL